jgi:hypothetical protein
MFRGVLDLMTGPHLDALAAVVGQALTARMIVPAVPPPSP